MSAAWVVIHAQSGSKATANRRRIVFFLLFVVDQLECEAGADSNEIEMGGQMRFILANPASHDTQSPDIQGRG